MVVVCDYGREAMTAVLTCSTNTCNIVVLVLIRVPLPQSVSIHATIFTRTPEFCYSPEYMVCKSFIEEENLLRR